ncbi:MAG: pro-sigmaK processing inhibitor BofA family protein [Schwartzia sp.]|nr:pro-sigmaK processing inhibitor BofA family protein [Schwartzia sp. (in: firmicutes)]
MESTIVMAFAVGLLAVCIIGKIVKLSIETLLKFVSNSIIGAVMLFIVNLFGLNLNITIWKALFAGIFGIPGVIAIIVWEKFIAG